VDKEYEKYVHIEKQNVEVRLEEGGENFTDIV
jgi:septum formation topological specificity factor MinE